MALFNAMNKQGKPRGAPKPRYTNSRYGPHRQQFEANKKIIYATQTICGICGKPVDKTLHWKNPMSKTVDHIIPISKNGPPSDINNLQLAHRACNRAKSDKLFKADKQEDIRRDPNTDLPQSHDWKTF